MSIASNGVVTFTQIPVIPNDSIGADQLAANAVGAQTKSKYSLDALEFTRDYFKYFLKEGAVNTFYQQNKDIAAQTFQKVNKVIFDTISQGRAIDVEEIQNIILERVPKK